MASGGVDISKVKQTLTSYKERAETTECLKLTPFLKCIDACGLSAYKTNIEASIWPQLQDKTKKVAIDTIATVLFDNLAADVIGKKRKEKGRASVDDDEVKALSNDLRIKVAAKAGATVVKAPKVDATTTRLTDTSGYTGSHKERFAKDGKGKGLEGRKDVAENSGYVGNYKGAGTFDKKH